MASLVEAAAALGISGAVMMLVAGSLVAALRVHAACFGLEDELFRTRQLEHLVDRAVLAAGAGPGLPPPVSSLGPEEVVFASDQNGDGSVDTTSSETTALEVRNTDGHGRVRVRLGRQTMTVLDAGERAAALSAFDSRGGSADAASTTLVELTICAPEGPASEGSQRLLFSLPARTMP